MTGNTDEVVFLLIQFFYFLDVRTGGYPCFHISLFIFNWHSTCKLPAVFSLAVFEPVLDCKFCTGVHTRFPIPYSFLKVIRMNNIEPFFSKVFCIRTESTVSV